MNSDPIPRYRSIRSQPLLTEGLSTGASVLKATSPLPLIVQADGILPVTGSTMLIPTGAYGYEYYALAWEQRNYDINVYSWFYVIADHDSTMVEITPVNPTFGGRRAGRDLLWLSCRKEMYTSCSAQENQRMKAMIFQVLQRYGLSATPPASVYPVAVFSGSSRAAFIDCPRKLCAFCTVTLSHSAEYYHAQHWGTALYLPLPPLKQIHTWLLQTLSFFSMLVKDHATIIKVRWNFL